MKLSSQPFKKFVSRIGLESAEGNKQQLAHGLQDLGKFDEAFSALKNSALDSLSDNRFASR